MAKRPEYMRQHSAQRPQRDVWRGAARPRRRKAKWGVPVALLLLFVLLASVVVYGVSSGWEDEVGNTGEGAVQQPGAGNVNVPKAADGRYVVVIDAGHGGKDGGTTNKDETILEKDITLALAQKLGALLGAHANDIQVVYTRQDDSFSTPAERAELANAAGADLFVSLHLNSDKSSSVRGFQVFAQPPASAYHPGSMDLAGRLVGKVQSSLGLPILGDSGVYHMFYVENADGSYTATPRDSTWNIEEYLLDCDTYGVLQKSNCTAILVEQWYLSNASDMALMYNEAGMDTMINCVYTSIIEYLGL